MHGSRLTGRRRYHSHSQRRFRGLVGTWGALAAGILLTMGMIGCRNLNWRGQNSDAEGMKYDANESTTRYVSKAAGVWGAKFLKVEGVALVTQLDNTGADPPVNNQRQEVLREMLAHQVRNANEILSSKSTSIGHVYGYLPPGIRQGERFDVVVEMLPECGSSLRGGYVMQSNLRPVARMGGSRDLMGHKDASAKGRILVDALFADNQESKLDRRGVILGGGVALVDRPLGLALQSEHMSIGTARSISRALNERFNMYNHGNKEGVAEPESDRTIRLRVPQEYRHNVGRYVQVVMNTAYGETLEQQMNRMEQLEIDLSDPALCETAALRLESIGKSAIPVLRRGLRDPSKEVRFHSAQALTYLDQTDGIAELKQAALEEASFRWHALTALTASSELDASIALVDLMHSEGAEVRYGAFHALRTRSPNDPLVAPDPVSQAREFNLNVVPTTASSMVHFARQHRPEIVVFGGDEPLESTLLYVERGLTIRVDSQGMIEISRFDNKQGEVKITCANSTAALIRTLTQIGCDYETIFDLCVDAKRAKSFNARVEVDRLPSSLRARNYQFEEIADAEEAPPETLPTMFGGPAPQNEDEPQGDIDPSDGKPKNFFDRMKASVQGQ